MMLGTKIVVVVGKYVGSSMHGIGTCIDRWVVRVCRGTQRLVEVMYAFLFF